MFRKGKICIVANFLRTNLVISGHSRERKTLSYSQINTVLGFSINFEGCVHEGCRFRAV